MTESDIKALKAVRDYPRSTAANLGNYLGTGAYSLLMVRLVKKGLVSASDAKPAEYSITKEGRAALSAFPDSHTQVKP